MQVLDVPTQEIVTLPPEGDESLPLGDSTKNFIRNEITTQLAQAIDKFNPHGWGLVTYWLRQLGPIATSIAVVVALIVFAATQFNLANTRLAKQATFEINTERDLKEIRDDIKAIRGDLAKQSLANHADLPLDKFKATLPDLNAALAAAKQQNVKVPSNIITDLQDKFTKSTDAPNFWPTAAQFISYRSLNTVAHVPNLVNLPNCADHEPTEARVAAAPGSPIPKGPVGIVPGIYQNCQLSLDSPTDTAKINWLIVNRSPYLEFINCLITYHGGTINLIFALNDAHVTMQLKDFPGPLPMHGSAAQTLFFKNCIFNFSFSSAPPPEGQKMTESLLAQSGDVATLNLRR